MDRIKVLSAILEEVCSEWEMNAEMPNHPLIKKARSLILDQEKAKNVNNPLTNEVLEILNQYRYADRLNRCALDWRDFDFVAKKIADLLQPSTDGMVSKDEMFYDFAVYLQGENLEPYGTCSYIHSETGHFITHVEVMKQFKATKNEPE